MTWQSPLQRPLKMSFLYNLMQGNMMKYGLVPHPAFPLGHHIFSNETWKHHTLDTQSFTLCLSNLTFAILCCFLHSFKQLSFSLS